MSVRKSVVIGSFYPDNKKELLDYFEKFNNKINIDKKELLKNNNFLNEKRQAL